MLVHMCGVCRIDQGSINLSFRAMLELALLHGPLRMELRRVNKISKRDPEGLGETTGRSSPCRPRAAFGKAEEITVLAA